MLPFGFAAGIAGRVVSSLRLQTRRPLELGHNLLEIGEVGPEDLAQLLERGSGVEALASQGSPPRCTAAAPHRTTLLLWNSQSGCRGFQ